MESNKISNIGDINSRIRPIAPHLSIYKPQLTSTLSIFHRITGTILTLTMVGFIFGYQIYSFYGTSYPIYFMINTLNDRSCWLISTLCFLLLFSLYYHICNGVRHLMWDFGYALDLKNLYLSGYIVIGLSFLLTVGTWILPII